MRKRTKEPCVPFDPKLPFGYRIRSGMRRVTSNSLVLVEITSLGPHLRISPCHGKVDDGNRPVYGTGRCIVYVSLCRTTFHRDNFPDVKPSRRRQGLRNFILSPEGTGLGGMLLIFFRPPSYFPKSLKGRCRGCVGCQRRFMRRGSWFELRLVVWPSLEKLAEFNGGC